MEKTVLTTDMSINEMVRRILVGEISECLWSLFAKTKNMTVTEFFRFVANCTVTSVNEVEILLMSSLTSLIDKKKIQKQWIAEETGVSVEEIARIVALADEIENRELVCIAEKRINAYGGWGGADKHFVSHDAFWEKLGIVGDLSDVEEYEIA
jgi:hypothetical protein